MSLFASQPHSGYIHFSDLVWDRTDKLSYIIGSTVGDRKSEIVAVAADLTAALTTLFGIDDSPAALILEKLSQHTKDDKLL